MYYTDRSRIIQHQRCPRSRWWQYHYGGRGIIPVNEPRQFFTGKIVHEIMDFTILGNNPEEIIGQALDNGVKELNGETPEWLQEQLWLSEALGWVWVLKGLPFMLDKYEVAETEKEEQMALAPDIIFMARTDALLRAKDGSGLYIGSWKTTSSYDQRKETFHRHDMQGITEPLTTEKRIGEVIEGVQMVYLIKGYERKNDQGGYEVQNQFVYGWRNDQKNEWAHSYNFTDTMDFGGHRLGKGWRRAIIALEYPGGIQAWVKNINVGLIQPDASETATLLDKYLVIPEPIYRQQWEKDRCMRQILAQETYVTQATEMINEMVKQKEEGIEEALDQWFPCYEHSCDYPSHCIYHELCWLPTEEVSPLEKGFMWRTPNHPMEQGA